MILPQDKQAEEITVNIEIERPQLLPEIKHLGEQKKLKEIEIPEEKPVSEPEIKQQIVKAIQQSVNPETEKTALDEAPGQVVAKEKIEILKPDDESMLRYQDMVKQKIQSYRRYPHWAEKQRIQGISYLMFTLLSDGDVRDIKVAKSSGFDILDKEAMSTIKRACPFRPIPTELKRSTLTIEIALVFKLQY